jgi:hypothetical protein
MTTENVKDVMTHEEFIFFVKSKVNRIQHGYSYKGKKYTNITDLGNDLGYRFNGDKWIKIDLDNQQKQTT